MTPRASHIAPGILEQHVAVLGKTGSGKTSTAKLAIEQVVAGGARVCILDPIKSDWWGLTSSTDGRRAGLPFHILGGPHGHVSLHASAGKAIGEIVANGALPLSIIDMAEFEPGGQARFFVDFAPTLLRKMRGVVYLVIEEAHLFAPKERSGIGAENLSIHWAKMMATAGRSKGIRLVLVTQRTQALHNALLGSCDTLIAHRLTAPADQEPVVKWLKANTSKEVLEQVSSSLSSLKTGEGWICSGEARVFERTHFPRIATYDNTATPTGDGQAREVKTAPVDQEKLRAIIGDAVEQAKADDPRELRKQIAELKRQLSSTPVNLPPERKAVSTPTKIVERFVLKDGQLARAEQLVAKLDAVAEKFSTFEEDLRVTAKEIRDAIASTRQPAGTRADHPGRSSAATRPAETRAPRVPDRPGVAGELSGPESKILASLAELEALHLYPADKIQLGLMAGYTNVRSGGFSEPLGRLITGGYATSPRTGQVAITDAGRALIGPVDAPSTPEEMQDRVMAKLTGPEQKLLRALIAVYPNALSKEDLGARCGYTNIRSGGFSEPLGRLNTLGLVRSPMRGEVAAAPVLFLESRS